MEKERTAQTLWRGVVGFGAIVVGVWVALTGEEWVESLADEKRSAAYVERMVEDLRQDTLVMSLFVRLGEEASSAGRRLILELEDGVVVPSDSLALLVAPVSFRPTLASPRRTTYDEMTSTGALGLLPDEKLARAIEYYETTERITRAVPPGFGQDRAPWLRDLPWGFPNDSTLVVSAAQIRAAVLDRPEARSVMRDEHARFEQYLEMTRLFLSSARETLEVLEAK